MAYVGARPDGEFGALVELEEIEVEVLRSVVRQLLDLIELDEEEEDVDPLARLVGIDPHAAPSSDPALRRLLPDAFTDDEEASAEFRRFTERELRDGKVRHARKVGHDLVDMDDGTVLLDREGLWCWLGLLNDARLVLGERLQLTEENHDELANLPEGDPRASLMGLYGWLTYVQESLVQEALEPPSR